MLMIAVKILYSIDDYDESFVDVMFQLELRMYARIISMRFSFQLNFCVCRILGNLIIPKIYMSR